MSKLSLAVFNTQPPLFLGGVERRIIETAKRLRGEVYTTVYSGTKAGLRKTTMINGLRVVPFFSTDRVFPLDNWTFNKSLSRNAHNIKADVYEVHTASGYGLLNALKQRRINIASVQIIHGVLADEYVQATVRGGLTFRSKLANLLMWKLAEREEESAKKATLVVTISEYSKRKILEYYNIEPSKIRLVPNGVDTERFKPNGECKMIRKRIHAGNRKIVLFVGRLIPRKGLSYLIKAAKIVVKEQQETLFVIVGNGPLRTRLVADVETAGLSGNFVFLGDVSEKDLTQLYDCTDVFAFPSIQEGQGLALLEAQSSAKPVVAFNVSGVAEAVKDRETGLLVKPGSKEELAEALLKFLSDEPLRLKMGNKGREFVRRNLSWDVCAQRMLNVYREAIETI